MPPTPVVIAEAKHSLDRGFFVSGSADRDDSTQQAKLSTAQATECSLGKLVSLQARATAQVSASQLQPGYTKPVSQVQPFEPETGTFYATNKLTMSLPLVPVNYRRHPNAGAYGIEFRGLSSDGADTHTAPLNSFVGTTYNVAPPLFTIAAACLQILQSDMLQNGPDALDKVVQTIDRVTINTMLGASQKPRGTIEYKMTQRDILLALATMIANMPTIDIDTFLLEHTSTPIATQTANTPVTVPLSCENNANEGGDAFIEYIVSCRMDASKSDELAIIATWLQQAQRYAALANATFTQQLEEYSYANWAQIAVAINPNNDEVLQAAESFLHLKDGLGTPPYPSGSPEDTHKYLVAMVPWNAAAVYSQSGYPLSVPPSIGTCTFACKNTPQLSPEFAKSLMQDAIVMYNSCNPSLKRLKLSDALEAFQELHEWAIDCYDKLEASASGLGSYRNYIRKRDLVGSNRAMSEDLFELITKRPQMPEAAFVVNMVTQMLLKVVAVGAEYASDHTPITTESTVATFVDFPKDQTIARAPTEDMGVNAAERAGAYNMDVARDDCESLTKLTAQVFAMLQTSVDSDGRTVYEDAGLVFPADTADNVGLRCVTSLRMVGAMFTYMQTLASVNGAQQSDVDSGQEQPVGLHLCGLLMGHQTWRAMRDHGKQFCEKANFAGYRHNFKVTQQNTFEDLAPQYRKHGFAQIWLAVTKQLSVEQDFPAMPIEATGQVTILNGMQQTQSSVGAKSSIMETLRKAVAEDVDGSILQQVMTDESSVGKIQAESFKKMPWLPVMMSIARRNGNIWAHMAGERDRKSGLLTDKFLRLVIEGVPVNAATLDCVRTSYLSEQGLQAFTSPSFALSWKFVFCDKNGTGALGAPAGALLNAASRDTLGWKVGAMPGPAVSKKLWSAIRERQNAARPALSALDRPKTAESIGLYQILQAKLDSQPMTEPHKIQSYIVTALHDNKRYRQLLETELDQYVANGAKVCLLEPIQVLQQYNCKPAFAVSIAIPTNVLIDASTMEAMDTSIRNFADQTKSQVTTMPLLQVSRDLSVATHSTNKLQATLQRQKERGMELHKSFMSKNSENAMRPLTMETAERASSQSAAISIATIGSAIRSMLEPKSTEADAQPKASKQAAQSLIELQPEPEPEIEFEPEPEPQPTVAAETRKAVSDVEQNEPIDDTLDQWPDIDEKTPARKSTRAKHSSTKHVKAQRPSTRAQAPKAKCQPVRLEDTLNSVTFVNGQQYTTTRELLDVVVMLQANGGRALVADLRRQLHMSEIELECLADAAIAQRKTETHTATHSLFDWTESELSLTPAAQSSLASGPCGVFTLS